MMDRRVAAFVRAAEHDIAGAHRLLPDMPDHANFFCQQAAEKLARAVCIREGIAIGTTHSIGFIASRLPPGHVFRADLASLDHLSSAASAWRYPTGTGSFPPPPAAAAVARSLAEIEMLLPEIRDWLEE